MLRLSTEFLLTPIEQAKSFSGDTMYFFLFLFAKATKQQNKTHSGSETPNKVNIGS